MDVPKTIINGNGDLLFKIGDKIGKGAFGFPIISAYGNTPNHRFIAIELLGPSLHKLQKMANKPFSLPTVLQIGADMLSRLEVLHAEIIIHSDVKAENICVDQNHAAWSWSSSDEK